jgi:hypothetical protein
MATDHGKRLEPGCVGVGREHSAGEKVMSVDPKPLTLAEFLAWEERQPTKHEFRDGAVFALAGATDDHRQISMNLSAIIRPVLRGSRCRAYANDIEGCRTVSRIALS